MSINYKNFILLLFYWLWITSFIAASTNGNIYGKVFNTENDSPLVGANVVIINNNMGTATDNRGFYNIINVLPGKYTLRVSMIGFADYEIKDITISMNRTTYLEIGLTPDTIKYETIVVQAERPLVKRDISASVFNIQGETIQNLPATNLEDIISLQAGVIGARSSFVGDGKETTRLEEARSNRIYLESMHHHIDAVCESFREHDRAFMSSPPVPPSGYAFRVQTCEGTPCGAPPSPRVPDGNPRPTAIPTRSPAHPRTRETPLP